MPLPSWQAWQTGVSPASSPPFHSTLSALRKVTEGHQAHNPSWRFDRIPLALLRQDTRSLEAFNTDKEEPDYI
jgi:hypothetical protein